MDAEEEGARAQAWPEAGQAQEASQARSGAALDHPHTTEPDPEANAATTHPNLGALEDKAQEAPAAYC